MKTPGFLLMLFLTASFITINCDTLSGDNPPSNPFPPIKTRSFSPCSVSQEGSIVTLCFRADCGNVTTSIESEYGDLVYETNTTVTFGSSINIDTTGWDSGNYTLTVTNSVGVIYTTNIDIP
ncbi:MAG: DUF3244 domain-containing protein [Bacteroidota bacterium]|nr:DUF3244 domain-containing protein [Bacteroidota bacterium]